MAHLCTNTSVVRAKNWRNVMKIVFLFGNAAVGKMTVGQELMKITELRLFHNHHIIEPVLEIFGEFNKEVMHRVREVIFEELVASQEIRLQRNVTENRLRHKASKRDIEKSNQRLIDDDSNYSYSDEGQIQMDNYIRIDNSELLPSAVAEMIKDRFLL